MIRRPAASRLTSPGEVSRRRGSITLFGAFLALATCIFKATYSVTFDPPEHSSYRHIDLLHLKAFSSGLGGTAHARHASRFLTANIEVGAFVLLAGLVISCAGLYAKRGARAIAVGTMLLLCALLVAASS
jgi:hypothetical protein